MTSPAIPADNLIPREILFGNPDKSSPLMSLDGQKMAYLAPVEGVLNVWVGQVGSEVYTPITQDTERGIRFYTWAADSQQIIYIQDSGGNENWRIYTTNVETGQTRDLTPFEGVQARFVSLDRHFPGEALVSLNRDDPRLHDVYHLDLQSGELTLVAKNPGSIVHWVADSRLKVRAALATTPDGGADLLVREDEQSPWSTLLSWNPDDVGSSHPVGFTLDGDSLWLVDAREVNAARLVLLNLVSGGLQIVAEDPEYDVASVIRHPDTYEIQAVSFQKDRTRWTLLDQTLNEDFAYLATVQRGDFSIVSRDLTDNVWVLAYSVDNGPVSYYVYQRETRKATFLFDNQPELKRYTLAEMEPVTFEARDGLTIHGYLTLPVHARKGEDRLPLVLFVHGGPWARDAWGYNPTAQWFANRGYACLQVNYRGSTGYGKNFLNAGDLAWGDAMQNDLTDAVHWAIAQGIADPAKVAIYGGSYGGYAALAGAAFTPDLFCCAVDMVGPSNLLTLLRSIPPYWAPLLAMQYKRIGNPETQEELLRARSPLFSVERIKIPLLIAQGANDPRVKQAESEQIVEALKQKGLDYEYMLFPDEGHGFAKPTNRLKFQATAEKFLARHLGGAFEEA